MVQQRDWFYAEREGADFSIASGFGTGPFKEYTALRFIPKSNSKYALFAGALIEPGVNTLHDVYLTNGGVAAAQHRILVKNVLDQREAFFCLGLDYTGGGGAEDTFEIYYGDNTATVGLNKAFMWAIEITDNDEFTAFSTQKSGTQTTYQTWESRTIPAGNWLLIAYAMVDNITALPHDDTVFMRVYDGSSGYGETLFIRDYTFGQRDIRPWIWQKEVTIASDTTYTIEVKCGSGNGYYVRDGFFIAINLDDFQNNYTAESTGRTSPLAGDGFNFIDKTTLSVSSPVAGEHILITTHYIDSASTSNRVEGRVIKDSTEIFKGSLQPISDTNLNDYNYFWVKRLPLSAATTFKSQVRKVSGTFGVGIGESALTVLQMERAGNVNVAGTLNQLGLTNIQ